MYVYDIVLHVIYIPNHAYNGFVVESSIGGHCHA